MSIRSTIPFVRLLLALLMVSLLVSCRSTSPAPATPAPPAAVPSAPATPAPPVKPPAPPAGAVIITIDPSQPTHPISPFIYGVSVASEEVLRELRPGLNSWGGNPNSRYNWQLGHAWNTGSDWLYMNYGDGDGSVSDRFVMQSNAYGAAVRLALPTLGWVAKDNSNATCSFPTADGQCGNADGASCQNPGPVADPNLTSVQSDVASIVAWVEQMQQAQNLNVRFFAMDNEPELWGITHYDVHPTCTTYDEILGKYLEYATAVRTVAPTAELLGPVTCCWYFYWNSAAGAGDKMQHGNQDFLPWFLQQVRQHDEQNGIRTIDVLDIHFYPEGVYNEQADPATAAQRLRSTRSLWDETYVDESWINEAIYLIPRMKQVIAANYPGLKLSISEWNWGADKTMNGALAVADVLGILGREDVYLASYWTHPEVGSPGFHAFKMFTNYDGEGHRFGDISVQTESSQPDQVTAYASLDSSTGQLKVILINKDPAQDIQTALALPDTLATKTGTLYRYSEAVPDAITSTPLTFDPGTTLTLPAYSITLLVFDA